MQSQRRKALKENHNYKKDSRKRKKEFFHTLLEETIKRSDYWYDFSKKKQNKK